MNVIFWVLLYHQQDVLTQLSCRGPVLILSISLASGPCNTFYVMYAPIFALTLI